MIFRPLKLKKKKLVGKNYFDIGKVNKLQSLKLKVIVSLRFYNETNSLDREITVSIKYLHGNHTTFVVKISKT